MIVFRYVRQAEKSVSAGLRRPGLGSFSSYRSIAGTFTTPTTSKQGLLPESLVWKPNKHNNGCWYRWTSGSAAHAVEPLESTTQPPIETEELSPKKWVELLNEAMSRQKVSPGELGPFKKYYEPRLCKDRSTQEALRAIQKDKQALAVHFEQALKTFRETRAYEQLIRDKLIRAADIRAPHTWYPMTRQLRRKIIYHYGPTNSGKTHSAINALKQACSGVYCAPLRLLAAEIYERLNFEGIYCNLITGQERKFMPNARHYSMTVEMTRTCFSDPIEVAVIDEIQMISDEHRGYAWTEALLSLEAKEIHLCGNETVLELIKSICADTGDEFEAIAYSRLTDLTISQTSLNGDLRKVRKGDCLIVFSRKQIFDIRYELESKTSHRCCVVYGSLPPEVRVMQARLFNDPKSNYDILIASDAVGMGLNLNIKRVVFMSLLKSDGNRLVKATPTSVLQIAGRAGRAHSIYHSGEVTCFQESDVDYLRECLHGTLSPLTKAGIYPGFEQFERFASFLPNHSFSRIIELFNEYAQLDPQYLLSYKKELTILVHELDSYTKLTLQEKYFFAICPISVRYPRSFKRFCELLKTYNAYHCAYFDMAPLKFLKNEADLDFMEEFFHYANVYIWLSFRLPGFLDVSRVQIYLDQAVNVLNNVLTKPITRLKRTATTTTTIATRPTTITSSHSHVPSSSSSLNSITHVIDSATLP